MKKIYEAIDFDSLPYQGINFYLLEEQGNERARLWITKRYSAIPDNTDRGPQVSGIFVAGRVDAHREALEKLVTEDPFFLQLTKEYTSWDGLDVS